jgi:pimeloyl-ACP methyl ester carboxylesterase
MKKSAGHRMKNRSVADAVEVRVRRAYFECRFGQLNVRTAFPGSGGFDERTTLLCLHAESGSSRTFAGLLPEIAHDRSVYAPDLPGCGESDAPPRRCSIADYAGAMVDFVDTMHFHQLDLLGCEAGALIAAELALGRPQIVRRLALVAPLFSGEEQSASMPAQEDPRQRLHNGPAAQWIGIAAHNYEAGERLPLLRQPTLLVRFKDDVSEQGARARQLLRTARNLDLPERAADLFGSAPQVMARQLREFLDAH